MQDTINKIVFLASQSQPSVRDQFPELARMDVISVLLTVVTVLLAVLAVIGFGFVRSSAREIAKSTAVRQAEKEARRYLNENAAELIQEHLDDAQVVAALQRQLRALGIEDIDTAGEVDNDPTWRPTDD